MEIWTSLCVSGTCAGLKQRLVRLIFRESLYLLGNTEDVTKEEEEGVFTIERCKKFIK